MAIPPDPILRAATRWLQHLPDSGLARTRSLLAIHAEYSDLTETQYATALTWLEEVGLIDRSGRPATLDRMSGPQVQVFEAALWHAGVSWLRDSDQLIRDASDLPEDALSAAEAIDLNHEEAFTTVRRLWGKVDTTERENIGAAGEIALVDLLKGSCDAETRHLAAWADGYGYDISVEDPRIPGHIEVKSTTRRSRLLIYLSRNEFETMLRDPFWILVAVRLDKRLGINAIATVDRDWVKKFAPADRIVTAQWQSVRMDVPAAALADGVRDLKNIFTDAASPLLTGAVPWNA